ncbi:MAG: Rieske (2Fe-2S) protein [Chloroflexota bacterium]
MPGEKFHPVAGVDDLPAGQVREVEVDGRKLALANVRGQVYALGGVCLHQGGPVGQGRIRGGYVVCPWHAYMYDPKDGSVAHPKGETARLQTYPVEVEDGQIYVSLRRIQVKRGERA